MDVAIIKRRIESAIVEYDREYENANAMFDTDGRSTEEKIALFGTISRNAGKVEALREMLNFILVVDKIEKIKIESAKKNKHI